MSDDVPTTAATTTEPEPTTTAIAEDNTSNADAESKGGQDPVVFLDIEIAGDYAGRIEITVSIIDVSLF